MFANGHGFTALPIKVHYTATMPLSPSARLGPYEIVSAIGAGGMGEVYRARDTRLNRTVAINTGGNSAPQI